MSAKVLQRKKARLLDNIRLGSALSCLALYAIFVSVMLYQQQRKKHLDSLPNWANVVMTNTGNTPNRWSEQDESFDGLPTIVFINGQKWSLEAVDKIKNQDPSTFIYGETVCEKHVIFYTRVSQPIMETHDTIMHELFHAGACTHGGATWWNSKSDVGDDHQGIYNLGHYTAQLFHDNPELAAWLAK